MIGSRPYEGVAFSHRYHLERLLRTKRGPVRSIRLAGGAARSPVWAQMFADVIHNFLSVYRETLNAI